MDSARSGHVTAEAPADRARLQRCLDALGQMIEQRRLAIGEPSTGIELEVALVDQQLRPAMINQSVLEGGSSGLLTAELGRWNLEINLPPRTVIDAAHGALQREIAGAVSHADAAARRQGAAVVTIGILPTLGPEHLTPRELTDDPRYAQLDDQMSRARGEPFDIDIAAPSVLGAQSGERVRLRVPSVVAEAACTSLQLHLQLSPDALADYWNAAQAVAGVQVAMAANSPFLLGRRLWAETRVPLFTQAVDTRTAEQRRQGARPRVWFGERWLASAYELFEETVRHFDAVLAFADDAEDPFAVLGAGGVPALAELCAHNGTVWRWNRPVYDVAEGVAHLRLENRVLPAAPTAADAAADAVFFFGLVRTLAEQDRSIWHDLSFEAAADNFTAGARHGVEATVSWPGRGTIGVADLVLETLLPWAADGLTAWGVDPAAAARHLGVIEGRCRARRTGATWQTEMVDQLERSGTDRPGAMRDMLRSYLEGMRGGEPVHTWSSR